MTDVPATNGTESADAKPGDSGAGGKAGDIVARLRQDGDEDQHPYVRMGRRFSREAADEIERLRARVAELEGERTAMRDTRKEFDAGLAAAMRARK